MARLASIAVAAALAASARPAWAAPSLKDESAYAVMFGPNVGAAFHSSTGSLLGGELSFVRFEDGVWFGLYTDVVHDLGLRRTRFSFGPEMGIGPFGLDVGYVREVGEQTPMEGWRIRGILAAFFISAYAGPGELSLGAQRFKYREGGLLFKMPLAKF